MSSFIRKASALVLIFILAAGLCACQVSDSEADEPITMFVGLGNGQAYYEALHQLIEDELGIDVKFVYQTSADVTTAARIEQKNGDAPADIMITASASGDEELEASCLDFYSVSHITDNFTSGKLSEYESDNGCIYQLPFTSRLIGITYNKTLMEEMGWDVPRTFEDMKELKAKCDEAGIKFAVCGGFAAGHGFNWLFHMMGAQWLSTLEGTVWLEDFLEGNESVEAFREEAEYFREWYEAGLFGSVHASDWNDATEFSQTRALFLYRIVNDTYSYEGPMYDDNGNEIAGTYLQDEYATMPWISRDGNTNYFTCYDNMFLSLNKNLSKKGMEEKLEKCLSILELMTTEKAAQLYSSIVNDGYIAVSTFETTDSCIFSKYLGHIQRGYVQPWYYNYFDNDTVVEVGNLVNSYIQGDTTVSYDDIIDTLESCVLGESDLADKSTSVKGRFSYQETARLEAVCGARSLQTALDEQGYDGQVQVSLAAYTEETGDLVPFQNKLGVVNTRIYEGEFEYSSVKTIIPSYAQTPVAISMTGAEINEIVEAGLDKSEELGYDGTAYGPYPIEMIVRDGSELDEDETYLVAVNESCLSAQAYEKFVSEGRVVMSASDPETPVKGSLESGLSEYLSSHSSISPDNIEWE